MREIGSEFWDSAIIKEDGQAESNGNTAFLLSGRTAIDFIIKDIEAEKNIKSVMLPSYCCDSMIEPFLHNGVRVKFYTVTTKGIEYDFNNKCDAVLLIDLFGYILPENKRIAKEEFEKGKVVIYDATHKLDGNKDIENYISYWFCSYRKWFYCNFAIAKKRNANFKIPFPNKINSEYIEMRQKAARLKNMYINGKTQSKEEFLRLYSDAEQILNDDYSCYKGIASDFSLADIISIRKANAKAIISGLLDIPQLNFYRTEVNENDVPLFVPVFMKKEIRDKLRSFLIQNEIYCPIHWPISDYHTISDNSKEIYRQELSLVCDQRYNKEDIQRLISTIRKFFGEISE